MGLSHHAPQSRSPPSLSIFACHPCGMTPKRTPSKLIKNKTNTNHLASLSLQHLFNHPSGSGSCGVSSSAPFCPFSPTHKMSTAMSLVGFKASGHRRHWALSEAPLGYPAVITPHEQSLHTLQQVTDGVDVRVGQPKTSEVSGW